MEMTEGIARLINNTVDHAIKINNMEDIDYILSGKPFPNMPIIHLESQTFCASYFEFVRNGHDNAIKHLIFNYNISEENSIISLTRFNDIDDRVKQMFEIRKTQEELNIELKNNDKPSRKSKV